MHYGVFNRTKSASSTCTQHPDNQAKLNSPLVVIPGDPTLQVCETGDVFPEQQPAGWFSDLKRFLGMSELDQIHSDAASLQSGSAVSVSVLSQIILKCLENMTCSATCDC